MSRLRIYSYRHDMRGDVPVKTTIEIGENEIVRIVRDHFAKDMKYTEHEIRCTIVEVKE